MKNNNEEFHHIIKMKIKTPKKLDLGVHPV